MREIEFRGKRVDTGEWVYGGYIYMSEPSIFVCYEGGGYSEPVMPETVGQYTGFKDKNGVKIFEGDIVRYHRGLSSNLLIVQWDDYEPRFEFQDCDKEEYYISRDKAEFSEVIGNIHDNPELLEERKRNDKRKDRGIVSVL